MSIRGMNKEDVVHIYDGISLSLKKNDIMPFAAKWMDLEIVILSEVNQTEKGRIISSHFVCGILKMNTNELVYKTEIELQM